MRTEISLCRDENIIKIPALIKILQNLVVPHGEDATVHIEETTNVDIHDLVIESDDL